MRKTVYQGRDEGLYSRKNFAKFMKTSDVRKVMEKDEGDYQVWRLDDLGCTITYTCSGVETLVYLNGSERDLDDIEKVIVEHAEDFKNRSLIREIYKKICGFFYR